MATPHIACEPGDIAPLVIMPGDPKRAERIAKTRMKGARLVSDVRGIGAWTGTVDGVAMTAMASGCSAGWIGVMVTVRPSVASRMIRKMRRSFIAARSTRQSRPSRPAA